MCDYEIIEENRAGVVKRDALKIRCYSDGKETLYCARDLFRACGVPSLESAMKHLPKQQDGDLRLKLTLVPFPFYSAKSGKRTTATWFINEYGFRSYMKGRYIPKDIKTWLIEDVFTFKLNEIKDNEQFDLSPQLPDTKEKTFESKLENVVDLKEVIKKNSPALQIKAAHCDTTNMELSAAVDKMILAMLDVMKLLIESRSCTADEPASESVAS